MEEHFPRIRIFSDYSENIVQTQLYWENQGGGNHHVFTEEYEDKKKAVQEADSIWEGLADDEKEQIVSLFVLESENSDINAINHFDGDEIKRYK